MSISSVQLREEALQLESRTWDPGGVPMNKDSKWERIGTINGHVQQMVHCAQICAFEDSDVPDGSTTELDSHANMPVVGKHVHVIADTGHVAEVSPHSPDYKAMDVKTVGVAALNECPHAHEKSIIVMRNALHVPSVENDLTPSFIMRGAGLEARDVPKV